MSFNLREELKGLVDEVLKYYDTVIKAKETVKEALAVLEKDLSKKIDRSHHSSLWYRKNITINGVTFSIVISQYGVRLEIDYNDEIKKNAASLMDLLANITSTDYILAYILFAVHIDEFLKEINKEVEKLRKEHRKLAEILEEALKPFRAVITIHKLTE